MSHVVVCRIAAGALPALKSLRLRHLAYIAVHQHEILFGGRPETREACRRT